MKRNSPLGIRLNLMDLMEISNVWYILSSGFFYKENIYFQTSQINRATTGWTTVRTDPTVERKIQKYLRDRVGGQKITFLRLKMVWQSIAALQTWISLWRGSYAPHQSEAELPFWYPQSSSSLSCEDPEFDHVLPLPEAAKQHLLFKYKF